MGRIWNLEVKERETTLEVEVVEDKTMFQRKIIYTLAASESR